MIVNDKIFVTLGTANVEFYKNKGYEIPYNKDKRGRLRVTKEIPIEVSVYDLPIKSNEKILVKCEDCNKERNISAHTLFGRKNSQFLKNGETPCSDCANKRMSGINSPSYIHGSTLFPMYRNNARKRNIEFKLTTEEFIEICPSNCYYCGNKSNGVDRKYSHIGYVKDNCVPCCSKCNFIKNTTPFDEFVNTIKKMYNKLKEQNEI